MAVTVMGQLFSLANAAIASQFWEFAPWIKGTLSAQFDRAAFMLSTDALLKK